MRLPLKGRSEESLLVAEEFPQHGSHRPAFGKFDGRLFRPRLTDMALRLGFARRRRSGLAVLSTGEGEADLVHKPVFVALDQHGDVVCNGIEQRVEPFMVGLGEIAQDMAGHALFRAGVTDADAYAPVLLAAMSVERSDAVVTACARSEERRVGKERRA